MENRAFQIAHKFSDRNSDRPLISISHIEIISFFYVLVNRNLSFPIYPREFVEILWTKNFHSILCSPEKQR